MNIIAIAILGVLSGADTWVDIERYGKSKREWIGVLDKISSDTGDLTDDFFC
jgi:hypothetical protein